MRVSIIVPAYKEKEVNEVLGLLLKQHLPKRWRLDKIVVVACGYKKFQFLKDEKILVIKETKRSGKAHAMNLALKAINSSSNPDAIVVHNADVFSKAGMLKNLLRLFKDSDVGLTCVRPVPLNDSNNFVGFLNTLVWDLHHLVSLNNTKVGEVFAFRNVVKKIPGTIVTDEAYVESLLKNMGYKIVYVPRAVVFNMGPKILSEFIEQRRRIFTGHVHVENRYDHRVSTMSIMELAKALVGYLKAGQVKCPKRIAWLVAAIAVESFARTLGTIDFYMLKKVPYVWKISESSRDFAA
jgi:cellulose synthase/poly-beta-1,6-N-acetylglucosamine synthase-like glycosyltransferase